MNRRKQCWNCGSKDLEDMGDHVKCRDCGATYNDVPAPGSSPVTIVDMKTGGAPRDGHPTEYKVAGQVARKAQKAREAAQAIESPK
jgi:5-methylcytosine-specific restriction endonuclease McrA